MTSMRQPAASAQPTFLIDRMVPIDPAGAKVNCKPSSRNWGSGLHPLNKLARGGFNPMQHQLSAVSPPNCSQEPINLLRDGRKVALHQNLQSNIFKKSHLPIIPVSVIVVGTEVHYER